MLHWVEGRKRCFSGRWNIVRLPPTDDNNDFGNEDDLLLNMTNRGRGRPPRRRGFDDDFAFDRAPPGDMPRTSAPSWPSSAGFGPEHDATVKWFNPDKGFGFVALSDGSGDAFLHANTLNQAGFNAVSPGASLRVRIGQGQKGRQVSEVLSVDESTAAPAPSRRCHGTCRPTSRNSSFRRKQTNPDCNAPPPFVAGGQRSSRSSHDRRRTSPRRATR